MDRVLTEIVAARGSPESAARFRQGVAQLGEAFSLSRFHALFARVARLLGSEPVVLDARESAALQEAGGPSALRAWSADHCGRVALMIAASRALEAAAFASLVDDLFYRGESREREAVLRALGFLPGPERFIPVAVEACRSNVRTLFEAIAGENTYPARFFSDAAFAQMVLKAIFVGTSVTRIDGLSERATPELARMVEGYASERRAAGRTVPEDCARVIELAREGKRR